MTRSEPKHVGGFSAALRAGGADARSTESPGAPAPDPVPAPSTTPATQGELLRAAIDRRLAQVSAQEAELDSAMQRAASGQDFSNAELLRLQATVYAYGQNVEVATRVVDRAAGGMRHLLNLQL